MAETDILPSTKDYLKRELFHTQGGQFMLCMAAISTFMGIFYVGGRVVDSCFPVQDTVIQKNIIGDEKPETYIEKDGVRYFSSVDGKDISDLVK